MGWQTLSTDLSLNQWRFGCVERPRLSGNGHWQAYNIAGSHIANIWTAALSTGLQVDQSAIALSGCYKV